ncbi:glycosyltransferase [Glycomyces sp. TRM65418]|uniref:glycosyltransferase n=1 Tax=Glycomyces sp. TRM65418 TaxID=2867006 RepID=UPI001CE5534A|nr:glycosyltransferase [Glycomyces sp. TRM65418]MCC3762794.1 glycosyltransferase [Glycomyces sp. TRM65418]QZD56824.1 glycosyltransferase [Glycomyces sp. TRM65418]
MRSDRLRLLYLAFFFPPSRSSGVFRARATANHFAEQGWDVTVFKAPDEFFERVTGSVDPELTATVDPRIELVAPPVSHFQWETDLRRFGRFRGNFPFLAKRLHRWQQRRIFPDKYVSWGASSLREALRRHRERPFDLVVATGNPFAAFGAAWAFGKLTGRPYVVDYRDSWTLDQFANAPFFPPEHPAWKWERRVLRSAAASLHVNANMLEWHAERYPEAADRMQVVRNGWDPDVLPEPEATPSADEDRPLAFSYIGTLTPVMPIQETLAGFRRLRETGRHPGARLDLYGHFGFFAGSEGRLRTDLGLDEPIEGVHYRGAVPKPRIGSAYAASDVLMFVTGGSKYVTTGKVFEYMASGKPIVSVHEPGCAAEEVLRGYPLWYVPESLAPDDIAVAMAEAGDAARKSDPDVAARAREHAASFTRDKALERFEQWSRETVAKGGGR